MASAVPDRARVVIIGGGVMGCSLAYHLARAGCSDVLVLEQGSLSGGSTWHAAGIVGQVRAHPTLTSLGKYRIDPYGRWERETGQDTGWRTCGSVWVARTEARMTQFRRVAAVARGYDVEVDVISVG